MVDIQEVAFFYSLEKNTFLCTFGNMHYPLDFSLDQLETLVDPENFFRINRQYLIGFSAIGKIHLLSKSGIRIETHPAVREMVLVNDAPTQDFRQWLDR